MYRIIGVVILSSILFAPLPGCASVGETIEQTTRWKDRAVRAKTGTESDLASLQAQRESFPAGTEQSEQIDLSILSARAKLAALDAAIAHADSVIAEATNPTDGITSTTQVLLPFLPAPIQAPALLGAAFIATLVRSKQLKDGTSSIIRSIQHAIANDENFKNAFATNANTIRTIQTPLARRLVDKAQRKS